MHATNGNAIGVDNIWMEDAVRSLNGAILAAQGQISWWRGHINQTQRQVDVHYSAHEQRLSRDMELTSSEERERIPRNQQPKPHLQALNQALWQSLEVLSQVQTNYSRMRMTQARLRECLSPITTRHSVLRDITEQPAPIRYSIKNKALRPGANPIWVYYSNVVQQKHEQAHQDWKEAQKARASLKEEFQQFARLRREYRAARPTITQLDWSRAHTNEIIDMAQNLTIKHEGYWG